MHPSLNEKLNTFLVDIFRTKSTNATFTTHSLKIASLQDKKLSFTSIVTIPTKPLFNQQHNQASQSHQSPFLVANYHTYTHSV